MTACAFENIHSVYSYFRDDGHKKLLFSYKQNYFITYNTINYNK